MAETILSSSFFTELVLPFLLVFTIMFAILQKTEVLGKGKRQIDAIVAFVIGLILVSFPFPRDIIVNLVPLFAVIAIVLLVFMMLYSFSGGGVDDKDKKWMKGTFGVLIGLALVIALLVLTGYWGILLGIILQGGNEIATNIFFIVIIIAAIVIVLTTGKEKSDKKADKNE